MDVATVMRAARNPRAAMRIAIALFRGGYYRIKYRLLRRRVVIGRRFTVVGKFEIEGPGTVIIGDDCAVNSPRLSPTTLYTHAPDAVIELGDEVLLAGPRLGCQERIEVGDRATLSDARMMDTDFHALEVYDTHRGKTRGVSRPIVVGRNAWIGAAAMVLKGVTIGENSVVGAGAVVASDVPSNVVSAGNPARVVARLKGPGGGNSTSAHRELDNPTATQT